MKKFITVFSLLFITAGLLAQDKTLPYYEIPPAPATYSAGSVAARVVDGLGFRFYWATEGLRAEDLAYKPGNDSRTTLETIQHIYEMAMSVANATMKKENLPAEKKADISFEQMRKETLMNLKTASDILRSATDEDLKSFKIIYRRGDKVTEFPFWNHLNGPIADCLWHVGQIVSFRRASGNPFTDRVTLFSGKVLK